MNGIVPQRPRLRRNQRSARGRSAMREQGGRRWNYPRLKSLLRCCLGFNPSAESGLPQRIAFADQHGATGKLRAASFAEHGLPLLHAALIPGFVLTVESPAHFSKFRNANRVSHVQKIARPLVQDQITVVVERPGQVWLPTTCCSTSFSGEGTSKRRSPERDSLPNLHARNFPTAPKRHKTDNCSTATRTKKTVAFGSTSSPGISSVPQPPPQPLPQSQAPTKTREFSAPPPWRVTYSSPVWLDRVA